MSTGDFVAVDTQIGFCEVENLKEISQRLGPMMRYPLPLWEISARLISLFEMIGTYAHELVAVAAQLTAHAIICGGLADDGQTTVFDETREHIREQLEKAVRLCPDLGMRSSAIQVRRMLDDLPYYEWRALAMDLKATLQRITDDLESVYFLFVPYERAPFYDKPWCGEAVERAFEGAVRDIREAGNSFALGLGQPPSFTRWASCNMAYAH